MDKSDVLHKLIDVAAGRSNLPAHQADELHEAVTPGFTVEAPSPEAVAAAEAVFAARAAADAKLAAASAPAPVAEPVAVAAETS